MRIIDLHCDTLTSIWKKRSEMTSFSFWSNPFQVDGRRLQQLGDVVQTCAVFIDPRSNVDVRKEILDIVRYTKNQLEQQLVTQARQLHAGYKQIAVILAIEDAGSVFGDVDTLVACGVRMASLTWNVPNALGYPCTAPTKGLTAIGMEWIEQLNERKIIIDGAHLSEQGVFDVLGQSRHPIVISHANTSAVYAHPRNVSDRVIRGVAERGGVVGLTFCSQFTGKSRILLIEDWVRHLWHLIRVGGIEVIALGSDFDGIDNVTEFGDVSGLPYFFERLQQYGVPTTIIEHLAWKNAQRVFEAVLPL